MSSNRNGTFGFHDKTRHYDQIVLADVVAKAPMTDESPGPAVYSPLAEGQFPHAYTMRDVLAIRKASAQQFKRERRYDPQYSAHLLPEKDPELETAKLRGFLGPGSYEVGKDVSKPMDRTLMARTSAGCLLLHLDQPGEDRDRVLVRERSATRYP